MPQYHIRTATKILSDLEVSLQSSKSKAEVFIKENKFQEAVSFLKQERESCRNQVAEADRQRASSDKIDKEDPARWQMKDNTTLGDFKRVQAVDNLRARVVGLYNEIKAMQQFCETEPKRLIAVKEAAELDIKTKEEARLKEEADKVAELQTEREQGPKLYAYNKAINQLKKAHEALAKATLIPQAVPAVQLANDDPSKLLPVVLALDKVIQHIELLKVNEPLITSTLTEAAQKTYQRITNPSGFSFAEYDKLGKSMKGKASPGLKILGGLMILLGAAIVAAGAPFVGAVLVASLGLTLGILATVGAAATVAGLTGVPGTVLFRRHNYRPKEASKAMCEMNSAIEEAEPHALNIATA